jgi:predicted SAM-dependent methyltransferase
MEKNQAKLLYIGYIIYKKVKNSAKSWIRQRRIKQLLTDGTITRPAFPRNATKMIHIGCGEINIPGFINIDSVPFPHVHYVTDNLTDLSIFASDTIDFIYMSHVLEHVKISQVESVIWEMHRTLKIGGRLRISVPDFDKLVRIYQTEGYHIDVIHYYLMGGQDYDYNFHKSVFNRSYLCKVMLEMGFGEVHEWNPSSDALANFKDESTVAIVGKTGKRYCLSLNLEATK